MQRRTLVGDVSQPECNSDAIECAVVEWQVLCVDLRNRQVACDAAVDHSAPALYQHGGIDVSQHYMTGCADPMSEFFREIAGATRQIKYDMTFANTRLIDRVALP